MPVDVERRRRVMARSQKLGHCVCDPRKSCPCDVFVNRNVCPCAGERTTTPEGRAALTRTVRKAGCASKIGQGDLKRILDGLPAVAHPDVLVGAAAGDDAGVFRLADDMALVQTVDVFAPCVDDPFLFGQIAAANSLSDVYAMGGRPITALSIVGFPIEEMAGDVMREILRGGIEKMREAGCPVIGGHSINDTEVKCGFAVTGLIHPGRVVERGRAREGDVLVLTKPLGTGIVAFGAQIGRLRPECLEDAGRSMAVLNRDAAELMAACGAHACTDVTGFGLAGHLVEMVRCSGVSAEIDLSRLPVFAAVRPCLEQEILSGAIERNQEYAMAWVRPDPSVPDRDLPVLYDPQTSGGLLVSLPEQRAAEFVDALRSRGHAAAAAIGRIVPGAKGRTGSEIAVSSRLGAWVEPREETLMTPRESVDPRPGRVPAGEPCCDHPSAGADATPDSRPLDMFRAFMQAANRPGRVDRRTKKLVAIALSTAHRCRPCLETHLKGALAAGIAWEDIDEVADLAVAFGGCTAMMFYREVADELRA